MESYGTTLPGSENILRLPRAQGREYPWLQPALWCTPGLSRTARETITKKLAATGFNPPCPLLNFRFLYAVSIF